MLLLNHLSANLFSFSNVETEDGAKKGGMRDLSLRATAVPPSKINFEEETVCGRRDRSKSFIVF